MKGTKIKLSDIFCFSCICFYIHSKPVEQVVDSENMVVCFTFSTAFMIFSCVKNRKKY